MSMLTFQQHGAEQRCSCYLPAADSTRGMAPNMMPTDPAPATPASSPASAPVPKPSPAPDAELQASETPQSQQLVFPMPTSFSFPNLFQPAAPAPAPSTPSSPAPAPSTAPSSGYSCSSTDRSAAAVYSCMNAVRTNPDAYSRSYTCSDYSSWRSSVVSPRRPALRASSQLDQSAQRQANGMASMQVRGVGRRLEPRRLGS